MSDLTKHNLCLKEQRANKFPSHIFKTAVEESRALLHIDSLYENQPTNEPKMVKKPKTPSKNPNQNKQTNEKPKTTEPPNKKNPPPKIRAPKPQSSHESIAHKLIRTKIRTGQIHCLPGSLLFLFGSCNYWQEM